MNFSQTIPKSLSEEIKLFSVGKFPVYMKDAAAVGILGGIYWFLSGCVCSLFLIPYVVFAILSTVYLILPAKRTNPGKRNWEVILFILTKNNSIFYSLNYKKEDGLNE